MHASWDSAENWLALVDRLEEGIPLLVEDFLRELRGSRMYVGGMVTNDDVTATAEETFRSVVAALRSPGELPTLVRAAQDLGRRRVHQGVDMRDLVDAVQLDFTVLWRRLLSDAEDGLRDVLIEHVETIHRVVDRYAFTAREEFLRETARVEQDLRLANRRYLARLFSDGTMAEETYTEIAAGMNVQVDAVFELALFGPEEVVNVRRAASHELARGTVLGHEVGQTYVVMQVAGSGQGLADLLAEHGGVFYRRLDGLAAVRTAARGGADILRAHRGLQHLHGAEELLPGALLRYTQARLVPGYLSGAARGLEELRGRSGEQVVETVHVYLNTGTVKSTASSMYCHRNTVVNRLKAFEDATGLDVMVPRQAMAAVLLLAGR
jgi:hypothetical protein